jgi:endo-1,4-beta-xylanase
MKQTILTIVIAAMVSTTSLGAELTEEQILGQVDTRIERYRKGEVIVQLIQPDGKPLAANVTVRVTMLRHKFLFGCNIFKYQKCQTDEHNQLYEKHYADLLNFATLPFYWWNYTREQGKPADARTEAIATWCRGKNITMKGHPLAWNYGEPKWLPDDPAAAMQEQLKRIERCVTKYKGTIDIWDVVNEATHYDRPHCLQYAPKLTQAIKDMGVGEYVRQTFLTARKGNPDAILVINDYRTDRAFIDKVITKLVDDQGKRLYDVIGIQSHMHGGYWGAKKAWDVCERYAKFGVPLHFTETTVVSGKKPTEKGVPWKTNPRGENTQNKQVTEFYRVLFSHPAVEAITWWDFTDQNAWQRAPAGMLREDMQPKRAYRSLRKLLKRTWWTPPQSVVLGPGGTGRFRGFLGEYQAMVTIGRQRLVGTFWLDQRSEHRVNVKLEEYKPPQR